MVAAKKAAEPVEEPAVPPVEEDQAKIGHMSQWEFLRRPPTTEEVMDLLKTLPLVWGIDTASYAEYVQPLPARKKVMVPHPTNPNIAVEEHWDTWALYMSVGGRMAMLNAAQQLNNWIVEIVPEPVSPVGAPGYISLQERIVYREYITISNLDGRAALGTRSGTAWVPFSGGQQAAGSNPYEKVETSARGRALAGWGFGVFPGSGIASIEEIQSIVQNRTGMTEERIAAGSQQGPAENKPRMDRDDQLQLAKGAVERLRILTHDSDAAMAQKVGQYVVGTLGATAAYDAKSNVVHWDALKPGQLMMMAKALNQKSASIESDTI